MIFSMGHNTFRELSDFELRESTKGWPALKNGLQVCCTGYIQDLAGRTAVFPSTACWLARRLDLILLRKSESSNMERKITRSPKDAVRMPTVRLGKIEKRPYTNSICTQ